MSTSSKIDVEHLRTWIGGKEVASEVISRELVKKFRATLNLSGASPECGEPAPLLINYCLAQASAPTNLLGEDGHPQRGGFLPPVELPRRMWAGSTLTFYGALHVGDLLQRESRISDVIVKEGRSGVLCFVTIDHRIDVRGELKIEEKQSIVYRDAVPPIRTSNSANMDPAPAGVHSRDIVVSAPLLFRYSALTFNSHRIHYDYPYATQVEQYPGLVFHAPLQATLLLNYATELKGTPPKKFTFRGLSPLFDKDRVRMDAVEDNDKLKLWTSRENGPTAMSAEAVW